MARVRLTEIRDSAEPERVGAAYSRGSCEGSISRRGTAPRRAAPGPRSARLRLQLRRKCLGDMNCEAPVLPVGDGCKAGDAIVVRYGDANGYEIMVIDGGNLDSGKAVVSHIQSNFGYNAVVTHAAVTHPDADHASGMREVLAGLTVKNLWLHKPWEFAAAARPYFANKSWTDQGLATEIRKEYDIVAESAHCDSFGNKQTSPFSSRSPACRSGRSGWCAIPECVSVLHSAVRPHARSRSGVD